MTLGNIIFLGIFFTTIIVIFVLSGPRPDIDETIRFQTTDLGQDLDIYLAQQESVFQDIRADTSKEIIWIDPTHKGKTEFAIIYIHGFSASKVEIDPVPKNIAQSLNANLFLTRLSGHGRSNDAMAETKMSDWLDDIVEAISIGERLGHKVVLVTASTGATLATWAASQKEYSEKIDGIILISPNFAVKAAPIWLLNMPWAETLLPKIMGETRSFEPMNDGHRKGWTHQYPSRAIFPMAALLRRVKNIDKSKITTPALFIYSNQDHVMVPSKVTEVVEEWGGTSQALIIEDSGDPNNHVIAGDILSPNTTKRVSDAIYKWIMAL